MFPLVAKALLFAVKTRRGREVLFAAVLGAVELAQSDQSRKVVARARRVATGPQARRVVEHSGRAAKRGGDAVKRGLGAAKSNLGRR